MSIDAVTPLRRRMIEDMNARKLCAQTQRGHIHSCKRFAEFLKRSPETATMEDIRRFQLHLSETGISICNRNRIMTGVRFLFRVTLRRLDLAAEIYHIREPQKIPQVMMSPKMLDLLRQWWKVRPTRWDTGVPLEERWLFPGRKPGKPMTTRQLSRLFHETADAAGIKKNVTLHALRHSFATHLLEDDTDIRIIQALLGHDKLDTTARYTRVATGLIAGIESPLDRLSQPRKKPKKAKERGNKDQPTV